MSADVMTIVKQTPMNNCSECGYPTCMAFGVAVVTCSARLSRCPYITLSNDSDSNYDIQGMEDPETALLKELRSKMSGISLLERAEDLGGRIVQIQGETMLVLLYLGTTIQINARTIKFASGTEPEPRDQILLYNYLFFHGKGELSGKWQGLESFPDSTSKVVTLKKYTEDKLVSAFDSRPDKLVKAAEAVGGTANKVCHADVCMTVTVLPKVPIQIHFWDGDVEDGLPASVKLLFDSRALDFLDIESLIFAAERMAETMTGR